MRRCLTQYDVSTEFKPVSIEKKITLILFFLGGGVTCLAQFFSPSEHSTTGVKDYKNQSTENTDKALSCPIGKKLIALSMYHDEWI